MPLSILATSNPVSTLYHVGKIGDILKSDVSASALQKAYHAKDFKYGFELATPAKDIASLGEAIIVGGYCYTNSSDQHSKDYMHTLRGEAFKAAGIFIVPNDAEPSHLVDFKDTDVLSVLDFYSALYQKAAQPFAFAGLIEFSHLHANAICKAPINHHPIFENKSEFYNLPDLQTDKTSAFIMGVVADLNQAETLGLDLSAVLYHNPFDKAVGLSHHAHVLTLKSKPSQITEVQPQDADRVLHLLAEGSSISAFHGEIYTIQTIQAWGK